jgi:hypothetical protein
MSKKLFLVSVEARYEVKADSEAQAKAFAIAAACACGVEARGVTDRVELRGSEVICCSEETD